MARNQSPNQLKNLIYYQPGHKPVGGRPKGSKNFKDRAQKFLDLKIPHKMPDGTITDQTLLDGAILSLVAQAHRGNVAALKELFDRVYGKIADKVELTGKDGEALKINHSAHLEQLYGGMKDAFDVKEIEATDDK